MTYDYAGGGLKTLNEQAVRGFEVLEDGKWWKVPTSDITLDGNTVTLTGFENAEGIRYASSLHYIEMDSANLCSGTGLPAAAFSVEFPSQVQ